MEKGTRGGLTRNAGRRDEGTGKGFQEKTEPGMNVLYP